MLDSLFRSAIPPWGWAIIGLVPPAIIALYFLKLRRHPVEVPSTYLWKRSIEDMHVNSLWQKLRQSLLLLLQLLLIALAMFALLRPGWQGTELQGERYIFMVDNSASMGTTDVADAEHRLALAKQQVRALIDQMEGKSRAMLLSFGSQPRVEQEFTSNKRKLREKLDAIKLAPSKTSVLGALQLADGLANPGQFVESESNVAIDADARPADVYIFSDGRFAAVENFALGNLEPHYLPTGSVESQNLAITAFSARRAEGLTEGRQAFAQITNFSSKPHDVLVEVVLNGSLLDAKRVTIPAGTVGEEMVGESRGVTFNIDPGSVGVLEARIAPESLQAAGDQLEIDNRAFAALNERDGGRVLVVTPGNPVLEVALDTERAKRLADIEFAEPSVLDTDEHEALVDGGAYDLIIYDQCVPLRGMPRANTLFVGNTPPTVDWRPSAADTPSDENDNEEPTDDGAVDDSDAEEGEAGNDAAANGDAEDKAPKLGELPLVGRPQIIDWQREHPLLAHVELGNLDMVMSYKLEPPRGGISLIDSTEGVIAAIAPRDGFEDAVLGFAILRNDEGSQRVNTNWFNRHSFPTFWLNAVDYLVQQNATGEGESYPPGEPIEFRSPSQAEELVVRAPGGEKSTVARNSQQRYAYQDAYEPGVYEVLEDGKVVQRFAVNLFDGQESNVRLKQKADDDENDNVEAIADIRIGYSDVAATQAPARQEIWRPLLVLAIGVLMLEWYVYNRRVYV